MVHAPTVMRTHPTPSGRIGLVECIEACFDCAQTCISCADSCLAEERVQHLRRCVRLCEDCASVCMTTGTILSKQTNMDWDLIRFQLQACEEYCRRCAEECEEHAAHMHHCRICADTCRNCLDACLRLLKTIRI